MGWYNSVKKINGHHYLYRQRTYRLAGKVKTESLYIAQQPVMAKLRLVAIHIRCTTVRETDLMAVRLRVKMDGLGQASTLHLKNERMSFRNMIQKLQQTQNICRNLNRNIRATLSVLM